METHEGPITAQILQHAVRSTGRNEMEVDAMVPWMSIFRIPNRWLFRQVYPFAGVSKNKLLGGCLQVAKVAFESLCI